MYTKWTDLFSQSHAYRHVICISNLLLYLHNSYVHPSFYSEAIDIGQINIFYFLVIEQECKSNRPTAKKLKTKCDRNVVNSPSHFKIMLNVN